MTDPWESFLCRLAEALGWEETVPGFYAVGTTTPRLREASWLLTNDGQAYLIARVRAEKYDTRIIQPDGDNINVAFRSPDNSSLPMWERNGTADTEPKATAIATGKALSVDTKEVE